MNSRFSDYVTSGAFSLSLTRHQISALGMMIGESSPFFPSADALERKGLAERVPSPCELMDEPDRMEWRATKAGLICAALLREAGLTNAALDPTEQEFQALRAEIASRRKEAFDARQRARSALARLEACEAELANAKARIVEMETGRRQKMAMAFRLRDPLPDLPLSDLREALEDEPTQ